MVGIIGIIIAVIVLIVMVYNRISPVICVLVAALIAGFSNGMSIWEVETAFTEGMLNFMKPVIWLFILSSVYGKLMEKLGFANSIASTFIRVLGENYSILAFILATALLVYGGISVFTVIFCIYPIGLAILKKMDLPRYLLPGIVVPGQITFAMTALPGTPQMNNIIPAQYFGSNLMSAPVLGIICAILMFILSYLYIIRVIRRTKEAGIRFNEELDPADFEYEENAVPFWKAILPVIVLIGTYFTLSQKIIPNEMSVYQAVNTANALAILVVIAFSTKRFSVIRTAVRDGCVDWIKPLINLCIIIGFGGVVKATPGFKQCVASLLSLDMNVYVSAALCTATISGITASASGGIQITCSTFADAWLQTANPAILHRVCSIASCSLDSLPHSGGVYGTFEICKVQLKEGYKHVFVCSVVVPAIVTVIAVILANLGVC